jgi:hypothetical protein
VLPSPQRGTSDRKVRDSQEQDPGALFPVEIFFRLAEDT